MALLEDMFEGNIGAGLAIGIGAVVLAPLVGGVLRPAAKTAIKAGLFAYDRAREAAAHLNEFSGDIVAEARAELDQGTEAPEHRAGHRRRAGGPET